MRERERSSHCGEQKSLSPPWLMRNAENSLGVWEQYPIHEQYIYLLLLRELIWGKILTVPKEVFSFLVTYLSYYNLFSIQGRTECCILELILIKFFCQKCNLSQCYPLVPCYCTVILFCEFCSTNQWMSFLGSCQIFPFLVFSYTTNSKIPVIIIIIIIDMIILILLTILRAVNDKIK